MTTAFVFPGLDGMQRGSEFQPLLALPGFRARWRAAAASCGREPGFATFAAALDAGEMRLLPQVTDWRWPALAVTAMQLAVTDALDSIGERADQVTGYSIGDVARTLFAGAASFDDLIAFARQLPAVTRGRGRTVIAFAADAPTAERALLALGPLGTAASRLSERIVAVPGTDEDEPAIRRGLAEHGLRLFELAPCALHGPLQQPLSRHLLHRLGHATLRRPRTPVFSSQRLAPLADVPSLRAELAANVSAPFDFAATVRTLHQRHGVTRFVNIGPGRHAQHFVQHAGLGVESVDALELVARTGVRARSA
ncbi:MAG: acyltransferase domain-containing protein [Planctomycetes bacterium]|nr:acyltransferase domain-containing protein [Planctomycetota bacterium]